MSHMNRNRTLRLVESGTALHRVVKEKKFRVNMPPHQKVTAFETSPETIAGNSGVPGSYLPPRSGIRVSYDATDIARGDATSTAVLEASI